MSDNSDIYVKVTNQIPKCNKFNNLSEFFYNEFNILPKYFVRVPGRVNLIGEHIDYCGYPVLPMAIEQNILLAIAPANDNLLHLKNFNAKYKSFKCNFTQFNIEVPQIGGPQWYNYFLCGVKGVLDYLPEKNSQNGMYVAVYGNIPPASGLSSSSALVSSAVLATSYLHGIKLDKQLLATISAKCEQYIGTEGGGMDQAIAFLAQQGCAQYIDWNPLTATPVNLPKESVFVIANSLAEVNKAAGSDYNQRVVECRLGCRILAKKLNLSWRDIEHFAVLQKALDCTLDELILLAETNLTKDLFTRNDILSELDIQENEFIEKILTKNTKHVQEFKLKQRALHVLKEAGRVRDFRLAASNDNNETIKNLQNLMISSHLSLQHLYECSHPNLDRLVEISQKNGNVGARLTGAGWGGCIVALCDSIKSSDNLIEELKNSYYKDIPQANEINLNEVVFATSPQRGAEIFINNNNLI